MSKNRKGQLMNYVPGRAAPYVSSSRRDMARSQAIQNARTMMIPRSIMGGNTRNLPANLSARNSEVKAVDLPLANYALNQTGSVTTLNLVSTGSSFFNRIGRRIELKSIRISGSVQLLATANASADYGRIMIIYDRQTNGAIPTLADILQDTTQAGVNNTDAFSNLNLNNRDRFTILRDLRLYLPGMSAAAGFSTYQTQSDPVEPTFNIDLFVKLRGLVTQYKADSSPSVIGDIATGGLFLLTFGSKVTGQYVAQLTTRLRFNDS